MEDDAAQSAHTQGSGQSVAINISDRTATWAALLLIGLLAAYGAVKGQFAYDLATDSNRDASMYSALIYSHEIKLEAKLEARGIPLNDIPKLPKPPKGYEK